MIQQNNLEEKQMTETKLAFSLRDQQAGSMAAAFDPMRKMDCSICPTTNFQQPD